MDYCRDNGSRTPVADPEKSQVLPVLVSYHPNSPGPRVLAFGNIGGQDSVALWLARGADPEQLKLVCSAIYKVAIERLSIRLGGRRTFMGDAVPLKLRQRVNADGNVFMKTLRRTRAKVLQTR